MAVNNQTKKYLSPKQAAEEVNVTVSAVMKIIRAKEIKAEKLGWVWMIPVSEIPRLEEIIETKKQNN